MPTSVKQRVIDSVVGKQAIGRGMRTVTEPLVVMDVALENYDQALFAEDVEFHVGEELDSLLYPDTRVLRNTISVDSGFKFSEPTIRTGEEQAEHYLRASEVQREVQREDYLFAVGGVVPEGKVAIVGEHSGCTIHMSPTQAHERLAELHPDLLPEAARQYHINVDGEYRPGLAARVVKALHQYHEPTLILDDPRLVAYELGISVQAYRRIQSLEQDIKALKDANSARSSVAG